MIPEHLYSKRATRHQTIRGRMLRGTIALAGLTACHDLTGSQPLPSGTADPASYNTAAGALGQRNAALVAWSNALQAMIVQTGALTDELAFSCGTTCFAPLDQRVLPTESVTLTTSNPSTGVTDGGYVALHTVRGLATQALGQLATYDPAAPPALRGELYAVTGYAEILLADLFCSGVPLSTLNFQHDYTYAASSTTAQVYEDAIANFDSALALATDSSRIVNLARVGKGRALLDLGEYAQAAQAVASVPSTFQYQVTVRWRDSVLSYQDALSSANVQEADREGANGLPFVSSNDPRSAAEIAPGIGNNVTTLEPTKVTRTLSAAGFVPITVADGIEARLIQAEAALHGVATGSGSWLDQLNDLRAQAIVPGLGTSAPDQLTPLAMPTTDSARIALIFQERAEWLYLTAHRQGDLRRLLRQYKTPFNSQTKVYPTGTYPTGGFYGGDITAPIPSAEYSNPLFHGCIDRNA